MVKHGASGGVNQLLAVIDLLELHSRRENPRRLDLLHLRLDAADRWSALHTATHQHNALDDVLVVILPDDAETWLIANGDGGHVFDIHGGTVVRRQHRIAEVVH